MKSKSQLLAEKVDKVISLLDQLRRENTSLKAEKDHLKAELTKLRKSCDELKLGKADRTDAIKTKLTAVLGRLDELESLYQ
jgi:regulator of replication initiation timing